MPVQVRTIKEYKGKCSNCSWEGQEHSDREAASEELKRHQKSRHSLAAQKRRAEEGRRTVEQLRSEGYVK